MRIRIAAGLVALLASAGASAQPVPAGHQQHQAAAKHEHAKSGCCCDKHMREMMSMMHEMMKMQSKAMDQQVARGKITREDADKFEKASQSWMPMAMKIGGSISMLMYAFGVPFFWGFLTWLLGTKVFKADFEYMKGVEAAGLASVIYALAALLGSLVSLSFNKMISLTPAYFMGEVDPTNKAYLAMAALNPFYIWFVVVVAVSISVLAGVSLKKPVMWLLGLWVLHRAILIAIGMGQFVM